MNEFVYNMNNQEETLIAEIRTLFCELIEEEKERFEMSPKAPSSPLSHQGEVTHFHFCIADHKRNTHKLYILPQEVPLCLYRTAFLRPSQLPTHGL